MADSAGIRADRSRRAFPDGFYRKGARPAKRVGPEVAVGGLTTAERVAKKYELRAELAAQRPDGTVEAPVRVELRSDARINLQFLAKLSQSRAPRTRRAISS